MKYVGMKQLKTKRLILREFNELDVPESEFKNHQQAISNRGYIWAIKLKGSNKIIGQIGLKEVSDYHDVLEIRYGMDKEERNKGYMKEALGQVIDFVFNQVGANRLQGICTIDNFPSQKVMEKSGMKREGVLKKYAKVNDHYEDCFIYSIINSKNDKR